MCDCDEVRELRRELAYARYELRAIRGNRPVMDITTVVDALNKIGISSGFSYVHDAVTFTATNQEAIALRQGLELLRAYARQQT